MRLPLPRSLFARLMLIWLVGIALVLAVSLALFLGERERIGRSALFEGVANLHNARRAHTPVLVIVGDHATYHKRFDAPLESDIDAVAHTVSSTVIRSASPDAVAADAARRSPRPAPGPSPR